MSQHIYRELQSGRWAEINPSKCPCHGSGWLYSDLDTYHQCPAHGGGVPHPETEDPGDEPFDFEAHQLAVLRNAFRVFREAARRSGFKGDFTAACKLAAWEVRCRTANHPSDDTAPMRPLTPTEWVNAAEMVAEQAVADAAEAAARRQGYSCALEMRWAEEAFREDQERHGFGGYWEA